MNRKYYRICKNAGMSEEEIKKIDKVLDPSKKRMQREKKAMAEANADGFIFLSASELGDEAMDDESDFDIPDPDMDLEATIIHQCELEELRLYLSELSEDDRDILMISFSGVKNYDQILMEKYGLTRGIIQYRREKLIKLLRSRFDHE